MNVILLTNPSDKAQALAQAIQQAGINLTKIVVENKPKPPVTTWAFIKNIAKKMGGNAILSLLNQLKKPKAIRQLEKIETQLEKEAQVLLEQFIQKNQLSNFPKNIPIIETSTVNAPALIELLSQEKPDILVVYGTGILKAPILAIPKQGTLNAHTSILPEYKGTRSEFWQCYHEQYEHVGITIHFVDTGVDTGKLLFQKKTAIPEIPNPFYLRTLNTIAILENYPQVIQLLQTGNISPQIQTTGSTPTYKFADITLEKRMHLFSRIEQQLSNKKTKLG